MNNIYFKNSINKYKNNFKFRMLTNFKISIIGIIVIYCIGVSLAKSYPQYNVGANYIHTLLSCFYAPIIISFSCANREQYYLDSILGISYFKRYIIWFFTRWEILILLSAFWGATSTYISIINNLYNIVILINSLFISLNLIILLSFVKFIKFWISIGYIFIVGLILYFDLRFNIKIHYYVISIFTFISITSTYLVLKLKKYPTKDIKTINQNIKSLNVFHDVLILNYLRSSNLIKILSWYLISSIISGTIFWYFKFNNSPIILNIYGLCTSILATIVLLQLIQFDNNINPQYNLLYIKEYKWKKLLLNEIIVGSIIIILILENYELIFKDVFTFPWFLNIANYFLFANIVYVTQTILKSIFTKNTVISFLTTFILSYIILIFLIGNITNSKSLLISIVVLVIIKVIHLVIMYKVRKNAKN